MLSVMRGFPWFSMVNVTYLWKFLELRFLGGCWAVAGRLLGGCLAVSFILGGLVICALVILADWVFWALLGLGTLFLVGNDICCWVFMLYVLCGVDYAVLCVSFPRI